jgi:hypothetical protein
MTDKWCFYNFSTRFHIHNTLYSLQHVNRPRVVHYTRLARVKHSSILGPFVSYEKKKCCEYGPGGLFNGLLNDRKMMFL